ncbi:MAG: DUF429 domain-containing protein [Gemmatimonadales bacterium]
MPLPTRCAHADWSVQPAKRWVATASSDAGGRWTAGAPTLVGEPRELIPRLREGIPSTEVLLLGVDFPIGLPVAYGDRAGFREFREALGVLGQGRWSRWYEPAVKPSEIGLARPFYPATGGEKGARKLSHLLTGLALPGDTIAPLLRGCERATATRPDAAPLFWTIGAKQVGKAAISGWRELIVPLQERIRLWPFDGTFVALTKSGGTVLTETYPADAYARLGVAWPRAAADREGDPDAGSGKGSQPARQRNAAALRDWSTGRGVIFSEELGAQLQDGFGADRNGEDRFDAVVGLCGVLDTLLAGGPAEPNDPVIRRLEGWIFGLPWPGRQGTPQVAAPEAPPESMGRRVSDPPVPA